MNFDRVFLLTVHVDLRKAFDSVHHKAFEDFLLFHDMPARINGLLTNLYSRTESAVKFGGEVLNFFCVSMKVSQGCLFALSFFNTYMDWVLG